jgi:DNA-binding transcriptional ArsR family regulator
VLNYRLEQKAALTFAALADPSRRGMVQRLAQGPASVSELAQLSAASLPAIMQHLQVLEESRLVRSAKKGRVRTYWLEPTAFDAAASWITEQRMHWEMQADRLGDYLKELKAKEQDNG